MTTINELLERCREPHPDDLLNEGWRIQAEADRIFGQFERACDEIMDFMRTHIGTPANVRIVSAMQARRDRIKAEWHQLVAQADELMKAYEAEGKS